MGGEKERERLMERGIKGCLVPDMLKIDPHYRKHSIKKA